ncbi:MAG: hypothetical protein JNL42_18705 [Anaerolineae bacterium]|nr:hypothetical protein [Anaerolineae bacterium]
MQITVEQALQGYAAVYHKLYQRVPRDLRVINSEWVIVNGARMHVNDLLRLTTQLYSEYKTSQERKKTLVGRLIGFLKNRPDQPSV